MIPRVIENRHRPTAPVRRLNLQEDTPMSNKTKARIVKVAVYGAVITAAVMLIKQPLEDLTGRKWG